MTDSDKLIYNLDAMERYARLENFAMVGVYAALANEYLNKLVI